MIGEVFQFIYCMSLWQATLLIAIGTYVVLWLEKKFCGQRIWCRIKFGALLALIAAIAYTTLGNRVGGDDIVHALVPFHSYREVQNGGNPEIYRSNFMNVILFYPAGLLATSLLPKKRPGWHRCLLVVLALTAMSAGIEFLQYRYALGRCEIDDVIHNAVGGLLGSLALACSSRFRWGLKRK